MKNQHLEDSIKDIARIYFLALQQMKSNYISSGEIDSFSPFYRYYIDVERTFRNLEVVDQRVINNEFFYDAYRDWWVGIYTEKQFKKIKRDAVKHFMEVFNEIH